MRTGCGFVWRSHGDVHARRERARVRHKVLIYTWRQVFREAGVRIPDCNVEGLLRNTHVQRSPDDARRMDLIKPGVAGVFGG